tara:strand:- start:32 stop:526 length:495 start_codon:yes stop_codon:yes gene_type:complete
MKNFNIWKDFGCLHAFALYCILVWIVVLLFGADIDEVNIWYLVCFGIPLTLYGISKYNEYNADSKKQAREEFIAQIKNKASEKIFTELIQKDAEGELSELEIEEINTNLFHISFHKKEFGKETHHKMELIWNGSEIEINSIDKNDINKKSIDTNSYNRFKNKFK